MQQTDILALGLQDYQSVLQQMQHFTLNRQPDTRNQIWITEHPPVYTLGLNGQRSHLLSPTTIPVVETDRGGQITYHGPGQLIIYVLLDLKPLGLGPRQLVTILENAVINTLAQYGISAVAQAKAVYVAAKKIASLGLRIKSGCCYHGISINNAMDLTPFNIINPCGYQGLQVTQLADSGVTVHNHELAIPVIHHIIKAIEA